MVSELGSPKKMAKIIYLKPEFKKNRVEAEGVEELVPMTEEQFQEFLSGIRTISSLSELGDIRSCHDYDDDSE